MPKLKLGHALRILRRGRRLLINRVRLRHTGLDYLTLTLPAAMPALPEDRNWFLRRVQG